MACSALLFRLILFRLNSVTISAQAVNLGTAKTFAVLGGLTVTNTGPTILNGDAAVSPGSALIGFPTRYRQRRPVHAPLTLAEHPPKQ